MIELTSWEYLAALLAGTFFVSMFVSAIGPTGGLQLAVVTWAVPPPYVVLVHAWITGVSAAFRSWQFRHKIDFGFSVKFAFFSVAGSAVAIFFIVRLDVSSLGLVIGIFIIVSALGNTPFLLPLKRLSTVLSSAHLAGLSTGFLTVLVGATGPLLFSILIHRYTDNERLMATHSFCLTFQHLSKLLFFASIGLSIAEIPITLLTTLAASWAGTRVGSKILVKLPHATYRYFVSIVLIGSGILIIVKSIIS